MNIELMKHLARRPGLRQSLGFEYVDGVWPYLDIQSPIGIARVIGEAKQLRAGHEVYVRGQTSHHAEMKPSLFRGTAGDDILVRQRAERSFVKKIRSIPAKRFTRPNIAALMQHYGFRTTWLDAVDNLFVATWFATHDFQRVDGRYRACRTASNFGWLYLIEVDRAQMRAVDLRREHHPLSTRPHVQHGISLAVKTEGVVDLRSFVVATIRFPVVQCSVAGTLFDSSFLLPHRGADHTLRLMLKHKANDMAADVEARHHLSPGTLGRVSDDALPPATTAD